MHFFFQLNIVNEKMYEVLSDIYQEFLQLFDTDVFHMGGDEVNMHCYNTSAEIRSHLDLHGKQGTEDDILDLWRTFQRKAFRLVSFRFLVLCHVCSGGFHCTFSFLSFLSLTFQSSKFRNHFTMSLKYFYMVCYSEQEASSGPISFEVLWDDIWTKKVQSFEMPF